MPKDKTQKNRTKTESDGCEAEDIPGRQSAGFTATLSLDRYEMDASTHILLRSPGGGGVFVCVGGGRGGLGQTDMCIQHLKS